MTYSIIANWNDDGVPLGTNVADTEEQAKDCVAVLVSKGNDDAFYLEDEVADGLEAWRQPMFWKVADGKATLQQSLVDSTDLSDAWANIRGQRDAKLAESDWMANSDVTMSDAWKTYRQSLRDLPGTLNDVTVQKTITWPDEPS